jgi:hypothetical protein
MPQSLLILTCGSLFIWGWALLGSLWLANSGHSGGWEDL